MQNRSLRWGMPVFEAKQFANKSANYPAYCMTFTQPITGEDSLHYHECMELGRCLKGEGLLFINGAIHSFNAGTITCIPKGYIHDSHVKPRTSDHLPSDWEFIFLDTESLGCDSLLSNVRVLHDENLTSLYEVLFHLLADTPEKWKVEFELLIKVLLMEAERKKTADRIVSHIHGVDNEIGVVLNLINRDFSKPFTVMDLANFCNMSESHFRKKFTKNVGMSPQQYVHHVRILMADHLLKTTDLSIVEISEDVGFRSLSSFNRLFKQTFGCSPRKRRSEEPG